MTPRPPALLGIDIGSSELRAGLVTPDGHLLGLERARYEMTIDSERGFAEQDPEVWWTGLRAVTRLLLGRVEAEIVGIAVDGHGPSLTPVDHLGRPTRPAITWLDRRAAAEQAELAAATGLLGWSLGILPAALWVERHEPEVAARTSWYLNSWEAVAARLTGVARTSLVPSQAWPARDEMAALGLPSDRIAEPVEAGRVVGRISAESAAALGLPSGIPVIAGVVDAFASFHGAGIQQPGDAIDVGGSAGGFGVYWDRPFRAAGSFTTPAPLAGLFVIGGAMATTGRAVEWLRDSVLGGGSTVDQLVDEAMHVEPGADGLVFLPYLAGERSPIWDPHARGAFVGLSLRHGRAHLARAVFEATALALRHVAEPILEAGVQVSAMRVVGGPARNDAWNQIKADVTGFSVDVPRILETAVVGSAILASVGIGLHGDLPAAMAAMVTIDHRLEPNPEHAATYARTYQAYTSLHPALAPILQAGRSVAEAVA